MPRFTRWSIKSALLYLVAALLLALILAVPDSVPVPVFMRFMTPAYFHLFLVGWVTQMIFGVIYWMFPIITRERPRGDERLAWAVFALLNAGLLLRLLGEPLNSQFPRGAAGWLLALSALLQWLGGLLFLFLAWPRVKERYRGE